jgi:type I restriction enzyme S subunit
MKSKWKIYQLSEVTEIVSGGTPKSEVLEYWDGDVLWITPKDMGQAKTIFVSNTSRTISRLGLQKSSAKLIPKNSVILSTRAPIGHLIINVQEMATNQGCRGLIPKNNLDTKFLFYFLKSNIKLLNDLGTGTTFKELSRNALEKIKIPVPPIEEQKRIVEILDKAFEGIAQAEANTRRNLINARELFDSYLNQIFIQKKGDWETKTIADISTKIEYGSSSKSAQYENNDSIPVLRMGNIQNGLINWNDLVYTDRKDEIEKYSLQYNDVLFNRTNSDIHVGKSGIYKGERPAIFAGYLIRIHYKKEEINPDFLNFYLNSSIAREYGSSVMSRSINQANINGTKLKSYPIYIPSLPMQNKIVDSLYKLKNQAKKLETIYQRKLEAIAELKQSILEKAFTGQLSQ